jgi:predicted permease
MFLESFKITGLAVMQIFLLAGIGYFLVKKSILGPEGLNSLSRLVMEVTFPVMIFCQLIKDFRFGSYPGWWLLPLLSLLITLIGLLVGAIFVGLLKGQEHRMQFLSLVTFQNSGYLPLALVAAMLPPEKLGTVFIYIFLFLMGFNLVMFSAGVHMLTFHKNKKFELASLFSPPVVAIGATLILIGLGLNKFVPEAALKPLRLLGDCTLPLAMFVVGGSLAEIRLRHINKKAIALLILAKMIIMPLVGLWVVVKFRVPELIGLLIIIQLAMPAATTLSIITRHYKREDLLVSQGVFFSHIVSILTIPLFLSLYFALVVIK